MSIILRTNKGSALTYDEMDRNQSQFYYSSSLSPDGTKLRLFFTGSDNLDTATEDYGPTRYDEIQFPSNNINIPEAIAAGDNTQIQFNDNGAFGADSVFVFNKVQNRLGIGTSNPLDRVDIQGDGFNAGSISLRGATSGFQAAIHAKVNFYEGSTFIGRIGRTDPNNHNLYITNNYPLPLSGGSRAQPYGKVKVAIGDPNDDESRVVSTFAKTGTVPYFGVGMGSSDPNRQGTFVGQQGIGISLNNVNTDQSFLAPIPYSIYSSLTPSGQHDLIPHQSSTAGLLISSPNETNGGNIVVAINTDTTVKNEGFNIINAQNGSYANSEVIASFQANGKVGINTNFPSVEGLTVDGIISGSGNGQIDGTLTVGTIATGTADNTSALVATSTGLVQKIAAAPVPLGGIIMWSGDTNDIPEGWRLCKDGVGTVNNVVVPNLSNKFIIASSNSTGTPTSTIEGLGTGPTSTGGSTSYTPEGTLTLDKLLQTDIAPHHHFFLADDRLYNNLNTSYPNNTDSIGGPGSPSGTAATGVRTINGYDADSDYSGARRVYATSKNSRYTTTNSTTIMQTATQTRPTGAFTGTTASKAIIPPFYALAYIIYVGV